MSHGAFLGSFLLFAACALLIVATISSPIYRQIYLFRVDVDSVEATFGVFGYCLGTTCSAREIGYTVPAFLQELGVVSATDERLLSLTKAFILHPVAAGLAGLAFLIALCSDRLGFLLASLISLLAFIVSAAALAFDFAIFTVVRNYLNNNVSNLGSITVDGLTIDLSNVTIVANYGNAIWMVLAATATLFFASFVVCFSCCSARRRDMSAAGYRRY